MVKLLVNASEMILLDRKFNLTRHLGIKWFQSIDLIILDFVSLIFKQEVILGIFQTV